MRAQVLKAHGGPENFVLTDISKPAVEPGKLLIKVAASSVNQIDIKIRGGLPIGPDLPAVLGRGRGWRGRSRWVTVWSGYRAAQGSARHGDVGQAA